MNICIRSNSSLKVLLTVILASAFIFSTVIPALAAGPALTTAARPEAVVWNPAATGEPNRLIGDLKDAVAVPVGSMAVKNFAPGADDQVIIGSGFGYSPKVAVFDRAGALLREFPVYDPGMKQGLNVAAGDVNGDGRSEIIVGTRPGANAHVLVLDDQGHMVLAPSGFFPFGRSFKGGASVAVGDVDGDGVDEIVTAMGPGGEPRVKVWKYPFTSPLADFLAFDVKMTAGVNLAVGDVDGDGHSEILAVPAGKSEPLVRTFKISGTAAVSSGEFKAGTDFATGINVTIAALDAEGSAAIVVAPNGSGLGHVSVFDTSGQIKNRLEACTAPCASGLLVAAGRSTGASSSVLVVPADRDAVGKPAEPKSIAISITGQRLRAYEYGRQVKTFLVSTGVVKYPTPLGEFSVLAKKPTVLYQWVYGPNNPDNYDLGLTPWNLLFTPHLYIHYAPWHNNFGRRVSHGCVNVNLTNIKWIYGWAEVGTPVSISE